MRASRLVQQRVKTLPRMELGHRRHDISMTPPVGHHTLRIVQSVNTPRMNSGASSSSAESPTLFEPIRVVAGQRHGGVRGAMS